MLADFTKAFGRNFIIGYFIPSAIFLTVWLKLFSSFHSTAYDDLMKDVRFLDRIWSFAIWIFIAWTIGIILLVCNRYLIRTLYGYHLPLKKRLLIRQRRILEELESAIDELRSRRDADGRFTDDDAEQDVQHYTKLMQKRTREFPPDTQSLLWTGLGNIARAAEFYSLKAYGMEIISAWPRLITVLPDNLINAIDLAKAKFDFAVNAFFLTLLISLQYLVSGIITLSPVLLVGTSIGILLMYIAYKLAMIAAQQRGEYFKAATDLYRYDLLQQLGLRIPISWKEERAMWKSLGQLFVYSKKPDDERMPRRDPKEYSRDKYSDTNLNSSD